MDGNQFVFLEKWVNENERVLDLTRSTNGRLLKLSSRKPLCFMLKSDMRFYEQDRVYHVMFMNCDSECDMCTLYYGDQLTRNKRINLPKFETFILDILLSEKEGSVRLYG